MEYESKLEKRNHNKARGREERRTCDNDQERFKKKRAWRKFATAAIGK